MKKRLIHFLALTGIILMCVAVCYFRHTDPIRELVKFKKHNHPNIFILLLPLISIILYYFTAVIDWTVFMENPVMEVVELKNVKTQKNLLPVKDHLKEQNEAEQRLMEHTGRSMPGTKVAELQPVKEGEEKTAEYFYQKINNEINNKNGELTPVIEDTPQTKTIEIAPVLPTIVEPVVEQQPVIIKDGKIPWGASQEYPADLKAEVTNKSEYIETVKNNQVEFEEIGAKLPDPLNEFLINNHNRIFNNTIAIDERDRLDIVEYLKNEKGFSGSTQKLSLLIVEKLEALGKDYLDKQVVAAMLESDNPLLINEKKTNSLKQRARKQLLENADFQQALFSKAS